jgi:hypothetical protein
MSKGDLILIPPSGWSLSIWKHMGFKERLHAYRLAMHVGWPFEKERVRYCTDTNRVMISRGDSRDVAFTICAYTVEALFALIERRGVPDARARAEEECRA